MRVSLVPLFGLLFSSLLGQAPAPLRIAAAANLQTVFPALKAAFEAQHPGSPVEGVFGATGSLQAQVLNGAPFDVLLSADEAAPKALAAAGRGLDAPFPYAEGVLVLWVPAGSPVSLDAGVQTLSDPRLKRIALANARLAPYGAAAEATLQGAGLLDALRPRFVVGENIAQVAQYAQSGAVDAAFLALSQLKAPALQGLGRHVEVPASAHPPILQAGLILARTAQPARARAFRDFLRGPEGQAILLRAGYRSPR